ncbi:MAG TPA: preprotein translocase subunit YajC [Gemmatimonadaceae bacterium]|nr:preprotein translocase subunit YajC [Gemmatimonadaceae bacterium]
MIAHAWLLAAVVAQTAAPSDSRGYVFAGELVAIGIAFYLMIIRPQHKQRKTQEEQLRNLKKGDEVVTAGGIVGEVIFIKGTVKDGAPAPAMDDRITIKSAESRLIVERARIARVSSKTADSATSGSSTT